MLTYKTVRSSKKNPHPFPNLFDRSESAPTLDPDQRALPEVLEESDIFRAIYGKINRYGTPCPAVLITIGWYVRSFRKARV